MASTYPSIFLLVFLCLFGVQSKTIENGPNKTVKSNFSVHIGALVDLSSPLGAMLEVCTSMALSDFYAKHPNYQMRLFLHTKDSKDVSGTVLAVLDLLKNEEVHAIIGPQRSAEATFVMELAKQAHVPIVSFSATSPPLSPTKNPYFIRTAQNEGVLSIKPHVPESKDLENFKMRYERNFPLLKPNGKASEVNIFGLWAYDTIWALAMAVERIGPINPSFLRVNNGKKARDHANLGISQIGPRLRNEMLNTKFKGLSGEFHLVNGQLQQSAYEILNVIGKRERTVGYWSSVKRISRKLSSTERPKYSTSKTEIVCHVESTIVPKDSPIPVIRNKLKIGVPKKSGFTEFVKITHHHHHHHKITGYCIDVFEAVIHALPFDLPYTFVPFVNETTGDSAGSYDELLSMVKNKHYDAVVGDTTIVANRTSLVDFTLPFTDSAVTMLVRIRHGNRNNMWIFLKPFTAGLWLTIIIACIFIGLVIRVMEGRVNTEFRGTRRRQLRMILWFPFQLLAFPDREMVVNNYSNYVMVIWLFMAYILMQSYTANLASILTVNQLQPTFVSVNELKCKGYHVGYLDGSFVLDLLINQLGFNESNLKPYSTVDEYHHALSQGSQHGGVAAIFDEIPGIKIFLAKYSSEFMMVGPKYKTGGFGFAFPIGSPLVSHISRAILNVTEDRKVMDIIEKRYFGNTEFDDQAAPFYPDSSSPSPDAYSFAGLFIIAGIATLLVLLGSEGYLWQKPVAVARQYSQRFLSPQPSNTTKPTVESVTEVNVIGHSFTVESATKVNVVERFYAVESTTEVNVVELSSAVDNAEISPTISHKSDETSSREQGHSL